MRDPVRLGQTVLFVVFAIGAAACSDDGEAGGSSAINGPVADGSAATIQAIDAFDGSAVPEEWLDGFRPRDPEADEVMLGIPITPTIQPGEDVTFCTYLPVRSKMEFDIVDSVGYQSDTGHHGILHMVMNPQDPGTHTCDETDMVNSFYLTGAGGGGGSEGTPDDTPDGIGIRVPMDRQFMIEHHWINTTTAPITGQVAFNLRIREPSQDVTPSTLFTVTTLNIEVPPQSTGSAASECTFQEDKAFFSLGGHAHDWGTKVRLIHLHDGQPPDTIYETDWEPYFAGDPPRRITTKEDPYLIQAGDTLRVECEYDNTTDETLTFPMEMCVGFGFFFPGTIQMNCIEGAWPQVDDPAL